MPGDGLAKAAPGASGNGKDLNEKLPRSSMKGESTDAIRQYKNIETHNPYIQIPHTSSKNPHTFLSHHHMHEEIKPIRK
jgi:hypothetical protein